MLATLPPECMGAYCISMARAASDVLAVRLLQVKCGVASPMRVAPLFETREDLQNAPGVMERVLAVADKKGMPVSLETMTESNRRHYEHYGFDVVGDQIWVEGCVDPWVSMVRRVNAPKR